MHYILVTCFSPSIGKVSISSSKLSGKVEKSTNTLHIHDHRTANATRAQNTEWTYSTSRANGVGQYMLLPSKKCYAIIGLTLCPIQPPRSWPAVPWSAPHGQVIISHRRNNNKQTAHSYPTADRTMMRGFVNYDNSTQMGAIRSPPPGMLSGRFNAGSFLLTRTTAHQKQ